MASGAVVPVEKATVVTTRPFRFGVINERMSTATGWVATARSAESRGYAAVLIRDHFVTEPFGDQFAPIGALMAAACAATTLRAGAIVCDNDYRHPVVLAKEAVTFDILSGGRLELGIGPGWLRAEYAAAGLPNDPNGVRIARLEESIQVLTGLFAGGSSMYAGEYYQITESQCLPEPGQHPHLPLPIGAGEPRILRHAGRYADTVSLLTTLVASDGVGDDPQERLAETAGAEIAQVRLGAGNRFDQIELNPILNVPLTDDRQAAVERSIDDRGWRDTSPAEVGAMPCRHTLRVEETVTGQAETRERYGNSNYAIPDRHMEAFAPVVNSLAVR